MAVSWVLDTNAALYLLGGRLATPLPSGVHFVSVVTEMELLSYPSLDQVAEQAIRAFLSDVTIVGLTSEIKLQAIQFRRSMALRLPDAIIAATAMSLGATLLTNDASLMRIPGLSCQSVAVRQK